MRTLCLASLLAVATAANSSLTFLALGDWGGSSDQDPTAAGELSNNKGMGAVAASLGDVGFVLAMGDNFYEEGIQGTDHSQRFKETFEDVFTHPKLQVPWYAVAGNHDHRGNVTAQIDYTQISLTGRWQFPSLYYTFTKSFTAESGKTVRAQIIYIDSYVLAGMSEHVEATGEFVKGLGPPDMKLRNTQLAWLEQQLSQSQAEYLWVSAHYPVYSQCSHGPTQEIIDDVLPLLKKYKATGYLSGHDHCQGHFESDGLIFGLAGSGKECCYAPAHLNDPRIPAGAMKFRMDSEHTYGANGGFAAVTMTGAGATIKYHDSNGKTLFTSKAFPPRH